MRDLLTILASFLVLALTAALVGPYLVDWSGQRSFIEQRLAQTLGARVEVRGPISLALLPTPSLSVGDVSVVSDRPGGPRLTARRVDFELALAPLVRGELQFTRADLDRPSLRLSQRPGRGLILPSRPQALPQQIGFDEVTVRDGTVIIDRGAGSPPWSLGRLDFEARAASLAGPFSGGGTVGVGRRPVGFHFAVGARNGASFPLQANFDSPSRLRTRLDGALVLASAGAATRLSYRGSVAAQGALQLADLPKRAWRLDGGLTVDADGIALRKAALQIGPQSGGLALTLDARTGFSKNSPIEASGSADQIDADAFLAALGPGAGARLLEFLADSADSPLQVGARPLRLSFSTPAATLGSETLAATSIELKIAKNQPARLALRSQLPGDSQIDWNGTVETGLAAVLRGRLAFRSQEPRVFAAWLAPAAPGAASRLRAAPAGPFDLQGDIELSRASFDSRNLSVTAGRTVLQGSVAYTAAVGHDPARLFADLRSNALDLDSLPDLSAAAQDARDMDLALSLKAHAVRLAHFGAGMVDAGQIELSMRKTGDRFSLDKFSVSNLGGAKLSASGRVDSSGADFEASLNADRLDELAAVAGRIAPGPVARVLAARAVALSPASLALHFKARRDSSGFYQPISMTLRGSARGSRIDGELTPVDAAGKRIAVALDLRGPDSSVLLRQIGVSALPIADTGAGRIEARAQTRPDGALAGSLEASIAGSNLSFKGEVAHWLTAPVASGRAVWSSRDAVPLLRLMTLVLPDASQSLPLSVAAQVAASANSLTLTDLSGSIVGDRVAGSATLLAGADPAGPKLSGALSVDRLSVPDLAALALGPPAPAQPGMFWSKEKFAPGLAAPPRTDLALSAKSIVLAPGWTGANASLRLRLDSNLVGLDDLRAELDGGSLSGALDLRRDGAAASATARLQARNIRLRRPSLSGRLSADAAFAASGASPMDLVEGLAGSGSVEIRDLQIQRDQPQAVSHVLALSDQTDFKIDGPDVERTIARELDRGPLALPSASFSLQTAAGMLRLIGSRSEPAGADAGVHLALAINLRNLAVTQTVRLTDRARPADWPDAAAPSIELRWVTPRPGAQAERDIESDALVGDLSTRAATREAERISALDSDIRERAFFQRRLKGLEFMHRREAEVAAWKAQQAEREKQARAAQEAKSRSARAAGTFLPPPAPPAPPAGLGRDPLSLGRF